MRPAYLQIAQATGIEHLKAARLINGAASLRAAVTAHCQAAGRSDRGAAVIAGKLLQHVEDLILLEDLFG
jgi:hypothetical protein